MGVVVVVVVVVPARRATSSWRRGRVVSCGYVCCGRRLPGSKSSGRQLCLRSFTRVVKERLWGSGCDGGVSRSLALACGEGGPPVASAESHMPAEALSRPHPPAKPQRASRHARAFHHTTPHAPRRLAHAHTSD